MIAPAAAEETLGVGAGLVVEWITVSDYSLVSFAFFKEFRLNISWKYYTYQHGLLLTAIIQPLRSSQNAFYLTL
jgi:hypothetical protein